MYILICTETTGKKNQTDIAKKSSKEIKMEYQKIFKGRQEEVTEE